MGNGPVGTRWAIRHGRQAVALASSRWVGALALLLSVGGCAGAGAGDGSGAGGQCNDGSWCGDRLDRDQDSLISPQEWDDAFNAADTNNDGMVSQAEFAAAGGNWGGGGRGGGR